RVGAAAASGVVAAVTAGPAYMAARKAGRAAAETAESEGGATREAVAALSARLGVEEAARIRERADTRADIRALRLDVRAVREWQAGHDAEHVAMRGRSRALTIAPGRLMVGVRIDSVRERGVVAGGGCCLSSGAG